MVILLISLLAKQYLSTLFLDAGALPPLKEEVTPDDTFLAAA
jgi:hypothetical protein